MEDSEFGQFTLLFSRKWPLNVPSKGKATVTGHTKRAKVFCLGG